MKPRLSPSPSTILSRSTCTLTTSTGRFSGRRDPFHNNHGRRHFQGADTALDNFTAAATGRRDRRFVSLQLFGRALALHREEPAVLPQQRETPLRQPFHRSDGTRGYDIGAGQPFAHRALLGTTSLHLGGERQLGDDFLQPGHPSSHRLQQGEGQIRASDRQRDAREPRPRAYVHNPAFRWEQLRENRRVQQMSFPEPVQFPRTDEPALDSVLLEKLVEPLGELQAITEYVPRRLRRTSGQDIHPVVSRGTRLRTQDCRIAIRRRAPTLVSHETQPNGRQRARGPHPAAAPIEPDRGCRSVSRETRRGHKPEAGRGDLSTKRHGDATNGASDGREKGPRHVWRGPDREVVSS